MSGSFSDVIRRYARPMEPIETSETPVIRKMQGLKVVLFDIYGTLLISASGDIESGVSGNCERAFSEALSAVGIPFHGSAKAGPQLMVDAIQTAHAQARQEGIEYPEIDIVSIWGQVLSNILAFGGTGPTSSNQGSLVSGVSDSILQQFSLEYEMRVNPVWPMPHARDCLNQLFESGLCLGIISNAQCFTIDILQTLLQIDLPGFEFDPELQYYSYQTGQAKPGMAMYQLAAESLARRGIRASEVLYIGNDMLKDVMPAKSIGFRTALFAGDARSLRRRKDDPRVGGVAPDLLITDLLDVPKCMR